MPVPSSGGIAVGEIAQPHRGLRRAHGHPDLRGRRRAVPPPVLRGERARRSPTATAGSATSPGVPTAELLSQAFADERACLFDPTTAQHPAGAVRRSPTARTPSAAPAAAAPARRSTRTSSTTHLSVVDRWGNAVSYTSTIEATGGSGITVPGLGLPPQQRAHRLQLRAARPAGVPDPNLPGPGKRPRSSMSPTMVVDDGTPRARRRKPGRRVDHHDGRADRPRPLRAGADGRSTRSPRRGCPRATARASRPSRPSPPARSAPGSRALGHSLVTTAEIGAATAVRVLGTDLYVAAAEPSRRGGGSAMVVDPEE